MTRRPETTAIASARLRLAVAEWWHAVAKTLARGAWRLEFKALLWVVNEKQRLIVLQAEQGGDHAA